MSISVLIAIAGVMVAAVGTGLLGGRCIRGPSPSLIAWTIGMSALTVALLGQSIGFATGFGAVTFRLIQITAQLLTPVVLAWGLVELVARGTAARFGARLAAAALIIVIGVILATDPLAARPFGRTWPSAAVHYQIIPHYALIALHLTVVVAALAAVALCAARGPDRGAQTQLAQTQLGPGQLVPGAAAVGAAAVLAVALRFTLPGAAYPAVSALSAGLVWFGTARLDRVVPGVSRAGAGGTRGEDFAGRPHAASHAGRPGGAGPGGRSGFPADGFEGSGRSGFPADGRDGPGEPDFPGFPPGETGGPGFPAGLPETEWQGPGARPLYDPGAPGAEPATGAIDRPGAALSRPPAPREPRPGAPGTEIVRPAPRPHGLIAIYTLLEDKVAAFDRIADEAAEQVRANEPDALVYVIHTVPKAPMQRIFYEIYRDRAAYEQHEQQPYIKRFVTARRPHVLATNVIELRLKYAKISPLVQEDAQAPAAARALPPAGGQAPGRRAQALGDDRAPAPAPDPGYGSAPDPGYRRPPAQDPRYRRAPAPGPGYGRPPAPDNGRAPAGSRALGSSRAGRGSPAGAGPRDGNDGRSGEGFRGRGDGRSGDGSRGRGDGRSGDGFRGRGDGRSGDGSRGRGDGRLADGPPDLRDRRPSGRAPMGDDGRTADRRRGRGQIPPPVPPRPYGGI